MRAFTEKHGAFVARLDASEREVVAALVADVAQLLGAPRFDEVGPGAAPEVPLLRTEDVAPPQDPAVRRLLPDASQDDPDVAAEFRRLTEDDLRARKVARLGVMWTLLTTPGDGRRQDLLTVAPKDAPELAAAITDLRLVLAERLDVRTDQDAEQLYDVLADDAQGQDVDVRRYLVSLYGALSWLQESLVGLMLEHARRGGASGGPSHEG
ncbi:DUF2017 domain-containing protein [Cellulomonas fimi]|uniref:DUF2017 domain-containing protein n=1 Tax=Cellulomonas fimi TaxID=1708 RepID=UPI00234D5ABD|nr:DUF2017 domain-containing protein [Cellulomonas fimi]MDC7122128.1 DUF2017 domain-containing protein [Cellulomonas fimi]